MVGAKEFLEFLTVHGNRGLVRLFWIFVLISLYVVFFGINTFERFQEESTVVITNDLDISSIDVKPGDSRFLFHISTQRNIYNVGMAILTVDPITGIGWKSTNDSNILNATGDELRKGLEDISYLYEEVVLATRYPASHYTLMSDNFNGLVQVLETSAKHFTYSSETTQTITLNQTPSYFMAFFDPTFAVLSGNPETIPRTVIQIPSSAKKVYVYLKVSCDLRNIAPAATLSVLAGASHEAQHREKSLPRLH